MQHPHHYRLARILLTLPLLFFPLFLLPSEEVTVVSITDGDTMVVMRKGKTERVRLIGIDAMEMRENHRAHIQAKKYKADLATIYDNGKKAAWFVGQLVKKKDIVSLEYDLEERDKYGRLLAYVYLKNGSMLNELILKAGHADVLTVPPNGKYRKRFLEAFRHACKYGFRLWGCKTDAKEMN